MSDEGTVSEYLGINITKTSDGGYRLTQPGLAQKILEATGMTQCSPTICPTSSDKPLGSDPKGLDVKYQDKWQYASVVGMLMYLVNSRPEIAFAVHQCARFTHGTNHSHEKAVLRICQYLKGTLDEGLVLRPSKQLQVDCYADADFAGLFSVEDPKDMISVKSRTGYVITFTDCPILWVSKLQTEITLSTLHAEHVALSQSLRDLLPIKNLIGEVMENFSVDKKIKFISKSTVYEDNNGAIRVATCPRLTPTSKFIAVKYHWFRQHVENKDIEIEKVDTKLQKADVFTKSLTGQSFVDSRKLVCGW